MTLPTGCQFDMSMPDWLIAFGRGCGLHREELLNLAVCEAASFFVTCTTLPDPREMTKRYISWYYYGFDPSNNL